MTSLAFILGVLPLAIATGAGANARHSIGTGIIGGMIGETTLAMLYVPLFFYIFDRLSERSKKKRNGLHPSRLRARNKRFRNLTAGRAGNMLRAIIISCIAVIAGCAVGPDYRRPDLDVPTSLSV